MLLKHLAPCPLLVLQLGVDRGRWTLMADILEHNAMLLLYKTGGL
jgi:hypothetical protein